MNTKAIFTFECKRSLQSNWRTRPVSLRSFELRYLEILHKFEAETSTLSDFMVELILFLLELIRKDTRVTENSHRQWWRNHRLFPLVRKFLYLLELNEFDLETIKSEVEAVTTFRTSIPLYNLDEHKNRSIDLLTDTDSRYWTRCSKKQLQKLLLHLWLPQAVAVDGLSHYFSGEFCIILTMTYLLLGENF